MTYILIVPNSFKRQLKKFLKQRRDLRMEVERVLNYLESDPFDPQLKIHPLEGQLSGCWAVTVTYSYRIVLAVDIAAREVTLLDIGSHDEVYR